MAQQAHADIRPSPIAGQWYPGNPQRLAETVDRMLEAAPAASVPGEIVGLVVPHLARAVVGPDYRWIVLLSLLLGPLLLLVSDIAGRLVARPIATMTVEAQEAHERREKVSRDD